LPALQFSGFGLGRGLRQISGTTVIYAGDAELNTPFADICLQLWVAPASRSFGQQDECREAERIRTLQNQLLTYRLQNWSAVKESQFDVPEFAGATREYGRVLGRCIVDAPDLQARVATLLRSRNDAERTEDARELDAVVLEALLICCHERKQSVHVGEVATLANAILTRNGEAVELSAKQVGTRLRKLGLQTTRLDSGGRGVYLLNGECARVHSVARVLGSVMTRNPLPGCPHCTSQ
jgi:hypothetical protein